jgi:hypothetical protein
MVSGYDIKAYSPPQLATADLTACIDVIKSGDAVDPDSAATELPRTIVLAVARS